MDTGQFNFSDYHGCKIVFMRRYFFDPGNYRCLAINLGSDRFLCSNNYHLSQEQANRKGLEQLPPCIPSYNPSTQTLQLLQSFWSQVHPQPTLIPPLTQIFFFSFKLARWAVFRANRSHYVFIGANEMAWPFTPQTSLQEVT